MLFAGHLAVALGAKRVEPRAPLAPLVAASFGLDLLWPVFLLGAFVGVLWAAGPRSAPPPSPTAIGVVGLVFGLVVVPWVIWLERHRLWKG